MSDRVTFRLGDSTWHDGPGWYYTIDDYPDEGSCGAFATREDAVAHAAGIHRDPHPVDEDKEELVEKEEPMIAYGAGPAKPRRVAHLRYTK